MRILIAYDDPDVLAFLRNTLSFRGFHVLAALDGEQAWELIRRELPDAVVLDVDLTGLDGFQVLRRLRADHRTRQIPVIYLSDRENLREQMTLYDAQADDCLTKPVDVRELTACVDRVLVKAKRATAPVDGRVVALYGVKGGVGTSALAASLAVALASSQVGTCLIDLDLEHACDPLLLDLVPIRNHNLEDIARTAEAELEWSMVESCLLDHPSGLRVLPGPATPHHAELVTGQHVKRLIEMARNRFRYVILDLASNFSAVNLDAFDSSDRILLVVVPELPALHMLKNVAEVLLDLGIPQSRVGIVVNRSVSTSSVPLAYIKRTVGLQVLATVPEATSDVSQAVNRGRPIVLSKPQHPVSQAIQTLASSLVAVH